MLEDQDHSAARPRKTKTHSHHHDCGNLFGCGDEKGTGVLREDIKDAAVSWRSSDRVLYMDEVNQEHLGGYLSVRGRCNASVLHSQSSATSPSGC
jgi:hypothetical protein